MLYRLSALFGEPVEELEERLTADQLQGYMAYYELEPWGCEADDHRFTHLAYVTAQVQSKKKLEYKDFLPPWRKPVKKVVPFDVGIVAMVEHMKSTKKG
jgi:hypothetical protein